MQEEVVGAITLATFTFSPGNGLSTVDDGDEYPYIQVAPPVWYAAEDTFNAKSPV
jgi:hypothetical protein